MANELKESYPNTVYKIRQVCTNTNLFEAARSLRYGIEIVDAMPLSISRVVPVNEVQRVRSVIKVVSDLMDKKLSGQWVAAEIGNYELDVLVESLVDLLGERPDQ